MNLNTKIPETSSVLNVLDTSALKNPAARTMADATNLIAAGTGVTEDRASEMVNAAVRSMRYADIPEGAAAEIVLMQARGLIGDLKAAIAALNPEAARAALKALKGLPVVSGPAGALIASYVSQALSTALEVDRIAGDTEKVSTTTNACSVGKSIFANPETQNLVFATAPKDVQEYFKNAFSAENYEGMTATIKDGKVTFEKTGPISGEHLRAAFTAVQAGSTKGDDRKQMRAKLGLPEDISKAEAKTLRDSLDKLQKFKDGKIAAACLSEKDQVEKLKRAHGHFKDANKQLENVETAQVAAALADGALKRAPSFLHDALHQFKEVCDKHKKDCHEKLAGTLEEGVIKESLMDGEASPERSTQQRASLSNTGLPTGAKVTPAVAGVGPSSSR